MEHPAGTFCFAELHTPDVEVAALFYGALFGWQAAPIDANCFLFQLHGQDVIAMRRTAGPQQLLGCVKVESADRMATRAKALGGHVITPPLDTADLARTCQ